MTLTAPLAATVRPGTGSALWFLSRGTGTVSLVLLTTVVVLGVLQRGAGGDRTPRFVWAGLHRNASLLVLAFLAVHIVTVVLDPYAPIHWADALVPFVSGYRPVWLGLGAAAFDLLLALVVTSLLRVRIGHRRWQQVHWLAYLAWPVAVLHGLGTGTDTPARWELVLVGGSVAAVVWALVARARLVRPRRPAVAAGITSTAVVGCIALVGWLRVGPLAPDWALRSGTPPALVGGVGGTGGTGATAVPGSTAPVVPAGTAAWTGTVTQNPGGTSVTITLSGPVTGGPDGRLVVSLTGAPQGSGVALTSGTASLLPSGGGTWSGPVTGLAGGRIDATLTDPATATAVRLVAEVQISADGSTLTGRATFAP